LTDPKYCRLICVSTPRVFITNISVDDRDLQILQEAEILTIDNYNCYENISMVFREILDKMYKPAKTETEFIDSWRSFQIILREAKWAKQQSTVLHYSMKSWNG